MQLLDKYYNSIKIGDAVSLLVRLVKSTKKWGL